MSLRNLLFDLDGTLTEPAAGITRSISHTLVSLGRTAPPAGELTRFIGPPIRQTFAALLGTDDPALVEQAVEIYRERFARVGMFENEVYAGVEGALAALRAEGFRLFVATSKARRFAVPILEHFRLARHFDSVHGARLDARLDDKADLVASLLRAEGLRAAESLMIGDREQDILAARRNGLRALGVTYGYGSRAELLAAGADRLCDSPAALPAAVRLML
jgi:phosphoglycolate phosphatase